MTYQKDVSIEDHFWKQHQIIRTAIGLGGKNIEVSS